MVGTKIDGWKGGRMVGRADVWMDGRRETGKKGVGWNGIWMVGRADEWMDGRRETGRKGVGWNGRWMVRWKCKKDVILGGKKTLKIEYRRTILVIFM